jgi:oligopeptide transport system substrate-binding protein
VEQGNRQGVLHLGNGTEPPGLDPHTTSSVSASWILEALFEGLITLNPMNLNIEPGVAMRWEKNDDGTAYTFYLNPEARWSNGDVVTAEDFVFSWERALNPMMASQNAYLLYPVLNSEEYATGKVTDFADVGIKALGKHTLQVTLKASTPYFLQMLNHQVSYPVHRPTIEKFGKVHDRFTRWTRVDNIVSNGAFVLKEWKLNRRIRVEPSEQYWDKDTIKLNGIVFYPTENTSTEERMYRAGQLHYTYTLPPDKVPVYREMKNTPYTLSPYLGTYFYRLNMTRPPMDDVRVRRALALSIDRKLLAESIMEGAVLPAYSITPPDTLGYFPPKLVGHNVEEARRLLAEAGYPNGEGMPPLELMYNTHEAHRKIAVAVQQMWKDALNIDVTLANQEWKVFLDTVHEMNYQIARAGWIGDYVDANTFLDMFICDGGQNETGFCDKEYDEMILRKAPQAKSTEERFAIFFEAETRLMKEMAIIPIYTYSSRHLTHPSFKGRHPNLMDWPNYKYMWLDPDAVTTPSGDSK